MASFLLEILAEEIPANALPGARDQLERAFGGRLSDAGFQDVSVAALSTSRRLVVQIQGLSERQPDHTERLIGPPRSVAFDAAGEPTKAADGFARKVGVAISKLDTEATPRGEYLAATVVHQGRATADLLAEMVAAVAAELRFPKMMRIGLGRVQFVRPVHGVMALLDGELVNLELLGIRSGRSSRGHRVHSPEEFALENADGYLEELSRRHVMVDPEQRRQTFAARAHQLATEVGCQLHPDAELMAEHVELVEYPGLLLGGFDARFLELPREVVIATLRHHQKCLVLEHADGSLAPFFLAVVDRRDDPEGLVRQGNEWVIGARLADARFFFEEDRRRALAEIVPQLEKVEFQRKLGSVADKARRIGELAAALAQDCRLDVAPEMLHRGAGLVKGDLVSHMVAEFPELQGVMGGHYLRLDGEPEELWTAARDHYQPQGFEGTIPESSVGRLLATADRVDTLIGLFGVGETPSGSRDPHGLRRAAQGLVRIAAEAGWDLDLDQALERAAELLADRIDVAGAEATAAVRDFLADRVRRYLMELVGVSFDTADAVMAAGWSRPPELVARARALEEARSAPEFRLLALAFKRVRNITQGQPRGAVDSGLFGEQEEKELDRAAGRFRERLDECLESRKFEEAFAAMADLAEVLDRFFDRVLVMADDETIRANRVALLGALGADLMRLADLSMLHIEGGDQ